MELRKKIRAKDLAMTHWIPSALMISGACSLEEPQPKFFPATMISPFRISPASSGRSGAEAVLFHIVNGLECQVLRGDDDIRIDIVPQDPDPSCK